MTVTSNIHVGLSAWSNHTFVLAERCSTGGNAYQCITAGTSTSAPTGTSSDVDNGGAAHFKWLSAIDFTTIQAWITGIPSTLTQPVIGQLWKDAIIAPVSGVAAFTLSGKTTTTTNTITLTCATGESFRDQAGALAYSTALGVAIQLPASGTGGINYIDISNNNVIIDGIQFKDPNSTSGSTIISISGSGSRIQNCIIDGFSQATAGAIIITTGLTAATGLVLENLLLIDRATTDRSFLFNAGNSTDTVHIINCTGISTTNVAAGACFNSASSTSSTFIVRNCAVFGYPISGGIAGSVGPSAAVIDHCVSDATAIGSSATDGGSNLFSKTAANQFVSSTTNFKLKAGADCLNAGVVDTTDIPAGDDVFKTARGATWDAGAFELVSAISVSRDFINPSEFLASFLVVRDFGTPNPWSSDFSSDFGPATTGFDASHESIIASDRISGIEFARSVVDDRTVPVQFGLTATRDSINPVEPSAVASVVANTSVPIEWLRVALKDTQAFAEWRSLLSRDVVVPNDTVSPFIVDRAVPTEWSLSARRDDASASEVGAIRITTPIAPIEWRVSFARDVTAQIEPDTTAAFGPAMPVEWQTPAVIMISITPIEFGGVVRSIDEISYGEILNSPFRDSIVPVDWSQPAQTGASFTIPAEFTNRIFGISASQPEFGMGAALDRSIPTEWTGNTGTTLSISVPLEWRVTFVSDGLSTSEWRSAFTTDAQSPISWIAPLATSSTSPAEFGNVLAGELEIVPDSSAAVRTVDASVPAEFAASPMRDIISPVAIGGSATASIGDALVPLEILASTSALISVPMNTNTQIQTDIIGRSSFTMTFFSDPESVAEMLLSTVGQTVGAPESNFGILTEDTDVSIEWLSATVSMSMVFPLAYEREIILDYVQPTSWFSEFSSDTVALIEWTHDTTLIIGDAATSLDFLSITVTDVVAYPEVAFGRASVGSQLEPDEWEKERD